MEQILCRMSVFPNEPYVYMLMRFLHSSLRPPSARVSMQCIELPSATHPWGPHSMQLRHGCFVSHLCVAFQLICVAFGYYRLLIGQWYVLQKVHLRWWSYVSLCCWSGHLMLLRHHWSDYLSKWLVALVWLRMCVVVWLCRCECGNTWWSLVVCVWSLMANVHTVPNYAPVHSLPCHFLTFTPLTPLPSFSLPTSQPLLSSHFFQCFVPRTPTHTVTCASLSDWTLRWSSMNTTMRWGVCDNAYAMRCVWKCIRHEVRVTMCTPWGACDNVYAMRYVWQCVRHEVRVTMRTPWGTCDNAYAMRCVWQCVRHENSNWKGVQSVVIHTRNACA